MIFLTDYFINNFKIYFLTTEMILKNNKIIA